MPTSLRVLLLCAVLMMTACGAASPPAAAGAWNGTIEVPGFPLRIGVHLGDGAGTIDVPAQGVSAMPLADVRVDKATVAFAVPGLGGSACTGTLAPDGATITGTCTAEGNAVPFALARGTIPPAVRPQEPKPPFPYRTEDVTVTSGDTTLAGTLTLPPGVGPFGAVLLISGSGSQDRDETLAGHKPFLLIADVLTRRGAAVLRLDDRGVGGSGGRIDAASYDELTADAQAAVAFLAARPEIDRARIGLLGHSEGGYLAPQVAQRSPGAIAFVAMLAGPAVSGEDVIAAQDRTLNGASPELDARVAFRHEYARLIRAGDPGVARAFVTASITDPVAIELLTSKSFRSLLVHDPAPALAALRVPLLAVFGDKDLQVPAEQSEPALRAALAGKPDVTIRTFPGLNHLLQPATTGEVPEYATIETTIAPEVLDLLTTWITQRS